MIRPARASTHRPRTHRTGLVLTLALLVASTTAVACSDDEGGIDTPDYDALAAYLNDEVGAIDADAVREAYPEPGCKVEDSSFVLVRDLNEAADTDDDAAGEVALHTQLAVDTYLCGPDFARDVIDATFEGESNTQLQGFINELEARVES